MSSERFPISLINPPVSAASLQNLALITVLNAIDDDGLNVFDNSIRSPPFKKRMIAIAWLRQDRNRGFYPLHSNSYLQSGLFA